MVTKAWTQQRILRLSGLVSLFVALCAVIADELIQYTPRGYASPLAWQDIASWRLISGHFLGILAILGTSVGYWHVCRALKLSGIKRTGLLFWLAAYGVALGAAGHATFAGLVVMIQAHVPLDIATAYFQSYGEALIALFLPFYIVVSGWYFGAVLFRRTLYPKWMAFCNPFLLSLLIALFAASNLVPVLSVVLSPAWLSLAHLVFFALSTLVLWYSGKEHVLQTA